MIDYRVDPPVILADDFAERDNIAWRIEPAHDRAGACWSPPFPGTEPWSARGTGPC